MDSASIAAKAARRLDEDDVLKEAPKIIVAAKGHDDLLTRIVYSDKPARTSQKTPVTLVSFLPSREASSRCRELHVLERSDDGRTIILDIAADSKTAANTLSAGFVLVAVSSSCILTHYLEILQSCFINCTKD